MPLTTDYPRRLQRAKSLSLERVAFHNTPIKIYQAINKEAQAPLFLFTYGSLLFDRVNIYLCGTDKILECYRTKTNNNLKCNVICKLCVKCQTVCFMSAWKCHIFFICIAFHRGYKVLSFDLFPIHPSCCLRPFILVLKQQDLNADDRLDKIINA